MSDALSRYKSLVDRLRGLSPSISEPVITEIDEELKDAWSVLCESERKEAEDYWRNSLPTRPDLN